MLNPAFTGVQRTRAAVATVSIEAFRGCLIGGFPNGRAHTAA